MTATSHSFSKVYDECFREMNAGMIHRGENAIGGPIENAFVDLDAILGPKQGLSVTPESMDKLARDLTLSMREGASGSELYQHVIDRFGEVATCHGEPIAIFEEHTAALDTLYRKAMVANVATEGGRQLHAAELGNSTILWQKPPGQKPPVGTPAPRAPAPTPRPETGMHPDPLIHELEHGPKKRKAIEFFTHDTHGVFSAGRTLISAAIVATVALGVAAFVQKRSTQKEQARGQEATR